MVWGRAVAYSYYPVLSLCTIIPFDQAEKVKRNRDAEIQKVERQKAEGQRGTKAESRNIESRNAEMQSETERLRYSEN